MRLLSLMACRTTDGRSQRARGIGIDAHAVAAELTQPERARPTSNGHAEVLQRVGRRVAQQFGDPHGPRIDADDAAFQQMGADCLSRPRSVRAQSGDEQPALRRPFPTLSGQKPSVTARQLP